MGIEKVVPTWRDLEVFLQLLPRSSTGERMNPYTSMWTGVTPGDGPQDVPPGPARQRPHRRARRRGRPDGAALHPLLGVPQRLPGLRAHRRARLRLGLPGADRRDPVPAADRRQRRTRQRSLPFASSLCGACYDVCPVEIDIPSILVHLRARHVEEARAEHRLPTPEAVAMAAAAWVMSDAGRWALGRSAAAGSAGCSGGTAGSVGCRRRCRAGRQRATPRPARRRPSASGGRTRGPMSARDDILARIRQRSSPAVRPRSEVPRDYRAPGTLPSE